MASAQNILAVAIVVGLAAGFGLSGEPSNAASSRVQPVGRIRESKAATVFVTDFRANAVYGYSEKGGAAMFSITKGLTQPTGIAIDDMGNLYVANGGANQILVYAPGQTSPSETIGDSGGAPSDVAVDSKHDIWVTSNSCVSGSCGNGNLQEYSPEGALDETITCATVYNYYFVAVDAAGDAFIAGYDSLGTPAWYKIAAGGTKCVRLSLNLQAPGGLKVTAQGDLVAVDRGAHVAYTYRQPGFKKIIATTPLTGTYSPGAIALNKRGTQLWVVDQGRNTVDRFAYPSGGNASVILNGLFEPVGVAVAM